MCFGESTSPPVSKTRAVLNIAGLFSLNWLNKGAVSQRIVILFSTIYFSSKWESNNSCFLMIYSSNPLSKAPQISKVQASKTIDPVCRILSFSSNFM